MDPNRAVAGRCLGSITAAAAAAVGGVGESGTAAGTEVGPPALVRSAHFLILTYGPLLGTISFSCSWVKLSMPSGVVIPRASNTAICSSLTWRDGAHERVVGILLSVQAVLERV